MSPNYHQIIAEELLSDPFKQFTQWYQQAQQNGSFDPTPMVLATVDDQGLPDTRIVLLKEFNPDGFIFYTHYISPKGKQAERTGIVAINFYWQTMGRQIRMRGHIKRVSREKSAKYFASRPRESQINTLASVQSSTLQNKAELLKKIAELSERYAGKAIPCPETWGGYCVTPYEYEFFQAENYRLNDRVRFRKKNDGWIREQLSP